jgi:hypothetical protein
MIMPIKLNETNDGKVLEVRGCFRPIIIFLLQSSTFSNTGQSGLVQRQLAKRW